MNETENEEYLSFSEAIETPGIYTSYNSWFMVVGRRMDLVNYDPTGPASDVGQPFPPTNEQFNGILVWPKLAGQCKEGESVRASACEPAAGVQLLKWRKLERLELRLCLRS